MDDHTLVYGSGNTLTFIRRDGSHVRSAPSLGKGVGCISVCAHAGMLAYSEVTLDPKIFLLSYPDLRLVSTLEGESDGQSPRVRFPSAVRMTHMHSVMIYMNIACFSQLIIEGKCRQLSEADTFKVFMCCFLNTAPLPCISASPSLNML